MRKSLTAPILLSLVALTTLTGCQAIQEESRNFAGREERLSNVVGNVWRLDFKWPGSVRATQINEALQQRAPAIYPPSRKPSPEKQQKTSLINMSYSK